MTMLKGIPQAAGTKSGVQTAFGGLNRNPGARDGAIRDMENMTSDQYPVLSSRPGRWLVREHEPFGNFGFSFGEWGELIWTTGGDLYYGGELKGHDSLLESNNQIVGMGNYVYFYPANVVYNIATEAIETVRSIVPVSVRFTDGTLNGEPAAANSIVAAGNYGAGFFETFFKPGDAIYIKNGPDANNGAHIIREISGTTLRFDENTFETTSTDVSVTIERKAPPAFAFMCECGNRLWGVSNEDNTIYACKLGDPFNWFVYDGLASDSYAVQVGSKGGFTGCIAYLGKPMFFKEDHIYKMYGNKPSNFELQDHMTLGVMEGCGKSLAIAAETLFYNSRKGIMAYTGSAPRCVQDALGDNLANDDHYEVTSIAAGSDGLKYYICRSIRLHGDNVGTIYVYDARRSMWNREDANGNEVIVFATHGGRLYYMQDDGRIWCISDDEPDDALADEETKKQSKMQSFVEFADFYNYTSASGTGTNRKYVTRLLMRMECESSITVKIMYDSSGIWRTAATIPATAKTSRVCSVPINRCDHYRIRLESEGAWKLHSISEDYVTGSGSNATVTV